MVDNRGRMWHFGKGEDGSVLEFSDLTISCSRPSISAHHHSAVTLSSVALVELLREVLARGAQCRFRATGFSMWPFVKDGDIVTVSPLKEKPPRLGDVVAFIHPNHGRLCLHRVVGRKGDAYVTRGDNALEPDGQVAREQILGRITDVERNGRKVFLGRGPERYLIAFLSLRGYVSAVLRPAWRLVRPFFRPSEPP